MWWFDAHELQASAYPESTVQRKVKEYLRNGMGFDMVWDLSQGRETQQNEGIPDLYAVHVAWALDIWVEVKQPEIRAAGARPNTTKIVQHRGKWRWKQEEIHDVLHRAKKHIVTVDHPEEVAAYVAWLGYPVNPNLYRTPFDPESQVRFRDPKAEEHWTMEKLRQRERRVRVRTLKRGQRVQQAPFDLPPPLIDYLPDIVIDGS